VNEEKEEEEEEEEEEEDEEEEEEGGEPPLPEIPDWAQAWRPTAPQAGHGGPGPVSGALR